MTAIVDVVIVVPGQTSEFTVEYLVRYCLEDARKIAGRFIKKTGGTIDHSEILSLAYMGLATAARYWENYCGDRGFDSGRLEFFRTYASRRIQGAILDYLRQADWATRSHRTDYKRMTDSGWESGVSLEAVGEATGLSEDTMRAAIRGVDRRPVSIDGDELDFARPGMTLEESVLSNDIERALIGGGLAAFDQLDFVSQLVLAFHYHHGLALKEVAYLLDLRKAEVQLRHDEAVVAVHHALVGVVQELPYWQSPVQLPL